MTEGWRKWFWRSAGFGAGFAATLAFVVGLWLWWIDRPKPPKPWNTKAIRVEYDYVSTGGEKNNVEFYYTLVNDTDFDYRVNDGSDVDLSVKLARENSISQISKGNDSWMKGDFPIFVPAHGRARFGIHIAYPYAEKYPSDASEDERYDYQTRLAKYVATELNNIDGFVMFDGTERYELVFPNDWKERAKQPMRLKSPRIDFQPVQPKTQ